MVLTNTAVRHAKPRTKNYTLPDFDGLALFVLPLFLGGRATSDFARYLS